MRFLRFLDRAPAMTRYFDPDDNGDGAAKPDDPENTETPVGDPPPPAVPPAGADLKAVADSIKQAILESRGSGAPIAAPIADNSATIRALEAEAVTVNARINELANAGDVAQALAIRDQFNAKVARVTAAPEADNEIVRTAVTIGERLARTEHKDVMTRWGSEVTAIVNAMPLNERVNPNAWDRAVTRVKADHINELIDEQVNARVTEARKSFVPPPATPGARGARRLEGPAAKLTEEQLWGADICGVEPAAYAAELKRETDFDALPFRERAKFPGYPLVGDKVTPGGF